MIEIEVNKEGYRVKIDGILDGNLIMDIIKEVKAGRTVYMPMAEVKTPMPEVVKDQVITMRERLPNTSKVTVQNGKDTNVVNITNKKADITKHKYFRCPECGQSHVIVVGSDIVVRDLEDFNKASDDQPLYVVKNVEATEPYSVLAKNAIDRVTGLVGDGELEGYCPRCDNSRILEEWFDAWLNPEGHFDYEKPCPICGGEMVFAIDPTNTGKQVMVCENKDCKYKLEG